jgi:hypothetical protein
MIVVTAVASSRTVVRDAEADSRNEGAGNSGAGREALDGVVDVLFGYLSKPCRALYRLNTATSPA